MPGRARRGRHLPALPRLGARRPGRLELCAGALGPRLPAQGPLDAFGHLPRALDHTPWLARDLILLCLYALLLVAAARAGVGLAWIAAGALVLVLPLFSGSVMSEGRFGLLALPAYWGLAWLARRRGVELALQATCLALLVAGVLVLPYFWP